MAAQRLAADGPIVALLSEGRASSLRWVDPTPANRRSAQDIDDQRPTDLLTAFTSPPHSFEKVWLHDEIGVAMFIVLFIAIVVLAMIGLGSVLGSGVAGLAALALIPILLLKFMFFMFLFGFVGRRFWYSGRRPGSGWGEPPWRGRSRSESASPRPSAEDRFDEWHRMAHAREEVDGWVSDLDDHEQE